MRLFFRAAEGIRTLDLLHGKQTVVDGDDLQRACKHAVSARLRAAGVSGISRRFTAV
jgi:hypothetical protein